MREPIKRGVKTLLDRISPEGWEPVEPVDPDRLWEAKRVDFEYADDVIDSFSGTSRSARLLAVNMNCRRWVPASGGLPATPRSSERTVSDAQAVEQARRNRGGGCSEGCFWLVVLAVIALIVIFFVAIFVA